MSRRNNPNNASGYTLVEVLLSLFIIIAIAVPLISNIFTNKDSLRSQEMIVAVWLLEQEAMKIRYFPESAVNGSKKQTIDGKEWTIKTEMNGSSLIKCHLVALHKGRQVDEVYVEEFIKK